LRMTQGLRHSQARLAVVAIPAGHIDILIWQPLEAGDG